MSTQKPFFEDCSAGSRMTVGLDGSLTAQDVQNLLDHVERGEKPGFIIRVRVEGEVVFLRCQTVHLKSLFREVVAYLDAPGTKPGRVVDKHLPG